MGNEAGRARRRRGGPGLPCALICLGLAPAARAVETPLVLLSRPAALDGVGLEALSRLEGELRGAEFQVIRRELEADVESDDPRPALERACREQASEFALALAAEGRVLRLWLYDGVSQRLSRQDWPEDDPHAPSVLAVQSVELVRATLAAHTLAASAPVPAPEAPPIQDVPAPQPAPERTGIRFGVELGVAAARELAAGVGSVAPLVRVGLSDRLGPSVGWAVRVAAAGLGTSVTLPAEEGSARVTNSFLLADAALCGWPSGALSPFVSVGAGVSRSSVEGQAAAGFYAQRSSELSPLGAAGLGIFARPFQHAGLKLEAQGLFATAPTTVRVAGAELATFGQPSLILSAALVLLP